MNKIARQALSLISTLASHLEKGRLDEARVVLERARPLSHVQTLAIEQLARELRRDWGAAQDLSPLEELQSIRSILVLKPDDVPLLERRLALERKVGGPGSISEALADLDAVAPGSAALASVVRRWNQEILTAAADGDAKRVFSLARRLGPWGGLDEPAFEQVMLSLATHGPLQEIVAVGRAHARRFPGSATRGVRNRLSGKAREFRDRGAFDDALLLETAVSVIAPPDESPSQGFVDTLIAGARPDENSAALLGFAITKDPDMAGRRGHVVSALLARLASARESGDDRWVCATQDSLEVLGGDTEDSRARALAAGLVCSAPESWLISHLTRMASRGDAGSTLTGSCAAWGDAVRAAMSKGDAALVWTLGRRLEAANRNTSSIRLAMLAAALRHPAEPTEITRIWSKLSVDDFDPGTRQHLRILRSVSQAALAQAKSDPTSLGPMIEIVLTVAALTKEGLRDVDALIEVAALTGRLEQVVAGSGGQEGWSAERHSIAGLALLKLQRPTEAEGHFQRAISLGVRGQLAAATESELAAMSLTAVGAAYRPGEDGTVVLESRASEALVGKVLEICPRVYVMAWADIDPDLDEDDAGPGDEDAAEVAAEDRIVTIPFRRIDIPPAAEAARVLAHWATEKLTSDLAGPRPWAGLMKTYAEEIERILFLKLFPRMREIYNSIEAASESPTSRTIVIWRSPAFRDVVAREILRRRPGHELRLVCGAVQPAIRRSGQSPDRKVIVPEAGDELDVLASVGLPEKASMQQFSPDKPTCWIVVPQARSDVLGTLPALIADMSRVWHVEVLFIDDVEDPGRFSGLFVCNADQSLQKTTIRTVCLKSIRIFSEQRIPGSLQEVLDDGECQSTPSVMGRVDVREEFAAALPAANRVFSSTIVVDEWLQSILSDSRPDAALFVHGSSVEQSLIAKRMEQSGIPTLWLQLMQHARDGTFVRPPSRHHLVIDQYSKSLWREHVGVAECDLTVVGSLRIDQAIAGVSKLSKESAKQELGIESTDQVILIATQTVSMWENIKLIEIAIRGSENIDVVSIVVKLHPGEPESRIQSYENVFAKAGFKGDFVVTKMHDTYRAIVASDLVMVQHSNVGIEAMLMDRPVVSVVTNGGRQGAFSLADHGFVEEIADVDEAASRIRSMLVDPAAREAAAVARRAYLNAHPELVDGNASQRIIDAIQLQMSLSQPKRSQK